MRGISYDDRIARLRETLSAIAHGLNPPATMSIARKAINEDDKLAAEQRRQMQIDAGED